MTTTQQYRSSVILVIRGDKVHGVIRVDCVNDLVLYLYWQTEVRMACQSNVTVQYIVLCVFSPVSAIYLIVNCLDTFQDKKAKTSRFHKECWR